MMKEEMSDWLMSLAPEDRLPLWFISYDRAGTAPMLNTAHKWGTAELVNVVVRESQAKAYRAAYPKFQIHGLPDDEISSAGEARWGAADLAYALGNDAVLMFDDDVLALNFMFNGFIGSGPNAGTECTKHSLVGDHKTDPQLAERILTGFSEMGREVHVTHPDAILGGMIKQHMSFSPRNHRTKYILNGGATARQVMIWNLKRADELDIRLNQDLFARHGEDIGFSAEILKAGADCWATPSFSFHHWPEDINIHRSVVRNAGNAKELHEEEWAALQQYPIKDYLRIKRSMIDNSYEWGDVNWKALGKLRGKPSLYVPWNDGEDVFAPAEHLI